VIDFDENLEPDAAARAADSAFERLGLLQGAPDAAGAPQETPAVEAALTRRELRERERAASHRRKSVTRQQQNRREGRELVAETVARAQRKPRAPKPVRRSASSRSSRRNAPAIVQAAPAPTRPAAAVPPRAVSRPAQHPSHHRRSFKRRLLSKLMTLGAMTGAGLMLVSTSIPANAFFPNTTDAPMEVLEQAAAPMDVQSISVAPVASPLAVARDSYTVTSLKEQLFLRYGNRNWAYTNNPNGTIQWPFPIAVPISDGFGYRISPCPGCSTNHKGVDFTPGAGAIIQAIADGVVSAVIPSHAGLGNHVIVDHHINGQLVQSVYAHMRDGSMRVTVGQEVKVTDEIGLVGSTGESTGAHLHLEIHVNGVPVDPFAWLKANAN
jgi:murein DD-endopeptidase MepM/ murein hydrolase activator NlpD